MKGIIVDDEPLMMRKFERLSEGIEGLESIKQFESPLEALSWAKENPVEVAFLDVEMPVMDGIVLAERLKEIRQDMIIVFITAYDEYIRDSNAIGGDYYIIKPYTREVLELMMEKLLVLYERQSKDIYVQTFGRFVVKKNNIPIRLTGKAKEIFALIVTRQGKEISNEEIYYTVWEGRPYSNEKMTVYYNALRRLKVFLKDAGLEKILISTARGQLADIRMFDCDYYAWKERKIKEKDRFEGEFLPEYSWGEEILADILSEDYE